MYELLIFCVVAVVSSEAANKSTPFYGALCKLSAGLSTTEPLTVSISPKIFTLADTEKDIINQAISRILSRNITKKKGKLLASYSLKLWNIKLDMLSISSSNISFQDFTNGVHLKVKGIKFHATANVDLEIKSLWKNEMRGNVTIKSDDLKIDAKMKWNVENFTFSPEFHVDSKVNLNFSSNLLLAKTFRKALVPIIDIKAAKKLVKIVKNKTNLYLEKLKRKVINYGFGFLIEKPIKWISRNNTLQIKMKPKGESQTAEGFINANKMVCVNGDFVQLFFSILSSAFSSFRSRREAAFKLDFTCVEPELKCVGTTCSFCTDIDLTNSSVGMRQRIFSCTPSINYMEWLKSKVGHCWTAITNKFQWSGEPTSQSGKTEQETVKPEQTRAQSYFTSILQWLL